MNTPSDRTGLQAEVVSYAYDGHRVLEDVSLGLRPGETVAIAGPNGSGKTTLLKLLSGARRPATGRVLLDGTSLGRLRSPDLARRIAVVSQHVDPRLMFSVRDIVAMGRAPYASFLGSLTHQDRRAIEEALAAAEIEALAYRRFGELSGGEQQRVMLAMSLAQNADYLVLDEPTVHLDLHHQYQLLELLRELRCRRGIGIVAVMHDLNLAALYFERLAILQRGRLVAHGSPAEILRQPEHRAIFQAPLSVVTHPDRGVPQVLLRPT